MCQGIGHQSNFPGNPSNRISSKSPNTVDIIGTAHNKPASTFQRGNLQPSWDVGYRGKKLEIYTDLHYVSPNRVKCLQVLHLSCGSCSVNLQWKCPSVWPQRPTPMGFPRKNHKNPGSCEWGCGTSSSSNCSSDPILGSDILSSEGVYNIPPRDKCFVFTTAPTTLLGMTLE